MSDILVLGALHYDIVVDAPRLPVIDETLAGRAVDYRFGGKGGNQAVAAARMGGDVAMAGRIGRDGAADVIRAALASAGVDDEHVRASDAATGMSVAITLPSGDYGAVIVSGSNLSNDGMVEWRSAPCTVVLQNEIPEEANLALVRRLPSNAYLVVNAAPARSLPEEMTRRTDLLVVNKVEAEMIAGTSDAEAAADLLARQVRGAVIVTLGADGLLLSDSGALRHIPAVPVKVVSTHGAGDMFVGALAARITSGATLVEAADFARRAAALFVSLPIESRAGINAEAVDTFE